MLNKYDSLKICSRCIYDERVGGIKFDEEGVCNYCHQIDSLKEQFGTGAAKGQKKLEKIIEQVRADGKGKPYDCIIGVSGGTDSSYMLYLAKEWGLRPLAVHYDNTWNTSIATQNIAKMLRALDIDLYTHVVNNKEADDIFRSFFMAGLAEIDSSTDLALVEVAYRAAWKYKIGYVFEGHSFVTEGISPLARNYFDGRYIREVHRKFGRRSIKSYPLMTLTRFLWWSCFARIKKIRPFWYIDYQKEEAQRVLTEKFNWQYYGGHHLENRLTAFGHQNYFPNKFGVDFRNLTLAARVREGKMERKQALDVFHKPVECDPELIMYFKKRLGISDEEYDKIMAAEPDQWTSYPTYKRHFEILRPLFYMLMKAELVPMSFYLKYCFPIQEVR